MTPDTVGPLSRPFSVRHLPPGGAEMAVEASPEECAALAADLGLPALQRLVATYRVTGTSNRVRVAGRLQASVTQTCVVTLDEFDSTLDEDVEVEFSTGPEVRSDPGPEHEADLDAPDELVGDRIDLGAITAEFLALGLDPHPRKQGAEFAADITGDKLDSPFSVLLKPSAKGE